MIHIKGMVTENLKEIPSWQMMNIGYQNYRKELLTLTVFACVYVCGISQLKSSLFLCLSERFLGYLHIVRKSCASLFYRIKSSAILPHSQSVRKRSKTVVMNLRITDNTFVNIPTHSYTKLLHTDRFKIVRDCWNYLYSVNKRKDIRLSGIGDLHSQYARCRTFHDFECNCDEIAPLVLT